MTRPEPTGERPRPRTAVVTGAASGMGDATVAALLAAGWRVIGLDRAEPSRPAGTPGWYPGRVDITRRSDVAAAVTALAPADDPAHGPVVDLVANIAGVYPPSTLETFTEHGYRSIFDVNVLGTLNVAAACSPHLRSGSAIVNFASVDAFTVSPGQLLYGASKAAVVMLTKSLALELAPRGVRVNAIAPGWVDTPGNAATGRMAEAAASVPLGRVAEPAEIAAWVLLLASGTAAFMTGETVVLSGGDVIR